MEYSGAAIVILGSFNPSIFTPDWLRANKAIEVDDGSEPTVDIIHSRISRFLLSDLQFTVERDRFQVRSEAQDPEVLQSVVNKLFGELLSHTPIRAIGMNFEVHKDVGSFEKRNKIGRLLAPVEPWGTWGEGLDNDDPELNGGLASLSMKKAVCAPPKEEYSMYSIEPSAHKELKRNGIFFLGNYHFGYQKDHTIENQSEFNSELLDYMNSNIQKFRSEFSSVVEHVCGV